MFFAHLQQIKFPSKWISSLAAFGGRATLFSLIFILFPWTNDLLYSLLCVTLLSLSLSFSCFLPSLLSFSCLLVNLGQAMESSYTVRKVYSDLLKALNAICFVPSLCPSPPRGTESWHPNETEWVLLAQCSILRVISEGGRVNIHWHRRTDRRL